MNPYTGGTCRFFRIARTFLVVSACVTPRGSFACTGRSSKVSATFCAAQVAATGMERIARRRLFPRSNRLKVFMTGFYAIVPGKIATDVTAEEDLPTAGRKSFGAIEGTRTPTPLPVHGPEPCASANSATMAIWTCNAAAAVRPPCQEDQPYPFCSPVTGCQTTTSTCSGRTWQPFSAQRGARGVAEPRKPKRALPQLRSHRNLRIQNLRYGTAFLRRLRILLKCRRIGSRDLPHHIDMTRCN